MNSNGYKYAVYGSGRVGTAVIYDLVRYCNAQHVAVFEPAYNVGIKAAQRLRKLLGNVDNKKVKFYPLEHRCFREKNDVIISCAPYAANAEITQTAIATKTPMVDLGGNPDMVSKQEDMARGQTTLIVPECGISPGISNMLAASLANNGYHDIRVRCGGVPLNNPNNWFAHKIVFSAAGLVSEYMGKVPTIQDGELVYVDALSTIEPFHPWEASPTSNNSLQAIRTLLDLGVHNYNYMTLRYYGHWKEARRLKEDGILTAEYLLKHEYLNYDPEKDEDELILFVEGSRGGMLAEKHFYSLNVVADPRTKFSAMEMTTAWGATIVAYDIVLKKQCRLLPKGFCTPEEFVDADTLLTALRRRVTQLKAGTY